MAQYAQGHITQRADDRFWAQNGWIELGFVWFWFLCEHTCRSHPYHVCVPRVSNPSHGWPPATRGWASRGRHRRRLRRPRRSGSRACRPWRRRPRDSCAVNGGWAVLAVRAACGRRVDRTWPPLLRSSCSRAGRHRTVTRTTTQKNNNKQTALTHTQHNYGHVRTVHKYAIKSVAAVFGGGGACAPNARTCPRCDRIDKRDKMKRARRVI